MTQREQSAAAFSRAQELMPGGVNSPARAFGAVGGTPVVIDRGQGSRLYDIDGNEYIDYVGSWGPMILGHTHPDVLEQLHAALERGTSYGAPTVAENRLAELIVEAVPAVEKVRLVNSGTEATMSAIRLARGYTGRAGIIKFAGNYHGHVDSLLVAAGSAAATFSVPDSPGVTPGTSQDTLIARYNDLASVESLFAGHPDSIAAVILEPVVGNMGCVPADPEFLHGLRALTEKHGALLIVDEVMTGFRVSYGGAQERYDLHPDLSTFGKVVGGGFPLAAYGGRREVMDQVLPAGKVFQAGTLSGNPIATVAGIATLELLRDDPPYERLESLSKQLAEGLDEAATAAGIPHQIGRCGSMLTLFFNRDVVTDWDSASRSDTELFARYFHAMLDRGIYLPCSQYEALFVSAAHTEEEIARTIAAAAEALQQLN